LLLLRGKQGFTAEAGIRDQGLGISKTKYN